VLALRLLLHPLEARVVVWELVQVRERDPPGGQRVVVADVRGRSRSPCSSSTSSPRRNCSTSKGADRSFAGSSSAECVPPEALDRIFDRFSRADDARTRTNGGVGLGLSIVAAIAQAHGGTCTVASAPGETVFALTLPSFRREALSVRVATAPDPVTAGDAVV